MYEFESRWTRGMKSRWTDYLDEPTLPLMYYGYGNKIFFSNGLNGQAAVMMELDKGKETVVEEL